MNITTAPLAMQLWRDPDGSGETPEQKAVALRLSITERVAAVTRLKERYAIALDYLKGVPLPYDCRPPELADECLEIERSAWRTFIDDLHLREILSVQAREKLDKQLYENTRGYGREPALPPFDEANVWGFFEQTCNGIGDMFKEAVVEVFKWLTPGQKWSGLKTNSDFRIGMKVICCGAAEHYGSGTMHAAYSRRARIDALGNVLSLLDGKGVRKSPENSLSDAWTKAWQGSAPFEDGNMTAKAFSNGNVHITFKRKDLVDQLNQAGAEATLGEPGRQESRGFSH